MTNQQIEQNETAPYNRLWVVWLLFFFQYAGIGIYFTFLNIYYRDAGLSGTQIGMINMATALIGVASTVIWGNLADRTGQSRLLIAIGGTGALIVAQFIPLVHSFGAFLGLGCLGAMMGSSLGVLVDSTSLVMLGKRRDDYGRYRMGGSIGYILTTGSVGFLFDRLGLRLMFPAYGVIMAFFAVIALLLPALPVRHEARSTSAVGKMIRQPAWMLFAAVVFLIWVAYNAAMTFLGVTLKSMGATESLIGIAIVIGAVVEVPFMATSGSFLRRFGPVRLLLMAMVLMVIRYFLLSLIPSPAWAIPINILNGPAYVFFWSSAVNYANRLAPPGLSGTAQGMLNSITNLAGVLSAIITGAMFDLLGPNKLFVAMSLCCLAALIIFAVGQFRSRTASPETASTETAPTQRV